MSLQFSTWPVHTAACSRSPTASSACSRSPPPRSHRRNADDGSSRLPTSSTAIEHGSRTPAASRAAERLRPHRRSRQIQTGSVGARLGRKSVREHRRLGAAVPIGRITLWVSTRTACPTHGYEPTREAAMAAFAKSWRRSSSKIGKSAFGGKAEKPLLMLSLTAFDALLPRDSEHFRTVPRTSTGFGGTVVMTPTGNVERTHAARSSQSSIFVSRLASGAVAWPFAVRAQQTRAIESGHSAKPGSEPAVPFIKSSR